MDCTRGDMIRVNLGSIYHYGIYVSDDEVIQFGYPPTLRNVDKDKVVVVATDIATFSCGKLVEVASFTRSDHKKRFDPEVTVDNARHRIGEEGYNIIHNNCEHFAYECYCGVHYSSQEEEARQKWSKLGFINVYFFNIPNELLYEKLQPEFLNAEVDKVANLDEKHAKYWVFYNLPTILEHTLSKRYVDIVLKNKGGKIILKDCYFSYCFSGDFIAVATSNRKIGVGMTNYLSIEKLYKNADLNNLFKIIKHKNENSKVSIENYAQLLAKKNSVIDYLNKNIPLKKINTLNYPISKFYVKNTYYFAFCGEHPETVRFFNIEKGKVSMFKGKLEE